MCGQAYQTYTQEQLALRYLNKNPRNNTEEILNPLKN